MSGDAASQRACETPFDAMARSQLPAWQETARHAASLKRTTLRDLFAADPARGTRLTAEACGLYLDFSKQRLTGDTLQLLVKLTRSCGVAERAEAMFRGERINVTERRAVLHVALRAPRSQQIVFDGEDVVPGVHAVLDAMAAYATEVRAGRWTGHTGKPIRAVVNIGIGGSDLGPVMACQALRQSSDRSLTLRFVSNVDGTDFAEQLLDELTTRGRVMARCFARAGVDVLRLGDDVGTQRGMMMSPTTWRRYLKPRLAAVIAAARQERPQIPIFYHSDGDVRAIIDELIEIGVTILNPVQPECMDPFALKRQYGDRLTLWGTVGTQTTLPHATPAAVRATVREYMRRLAPGGGYVIGPTHTINRDVPWENVVAFYQAVRDYGSYAALGEQRS